MKRSPTKTRQYSQHRSRSSNPERNYTSMHRETVAHLASMFMEDMQTRLQAAEEAGTITSTTRSPRRMFFLPRVTIKTYKLPGDVRATLTYKGNDISTPIRATLEDPSLTVNYGDRVRGDHTTISLAGGNPLIRFDALMLQAKSAYRDAYDASYATYANDPMAQLEIRDQIDRLITCLSAPNADTPASA